MSIVDRIVEKKVASFENEIMKKYYSEVENMYDKIRVFRHDFRHHIGTMKAHMENGEYEEVNKYLESLADELAGMEPIVRAGNRLTDAILNSKLSLAVQKNIRVKADANIPVSISVPEPDLCSILGNLIDNAVEACLELPEEERLIRLYADVKGNFLYFALTNTAHGKKKKHFRTQKGEGHGLGLTRIEYLVKKNGGTLSRASEDGAFSTEILLPI